MTFNKVHHKDAVTPRLPGRYQCKRCKAWKDGSEYSPSRLRPSNTRTNKRLTCRACDGDFKRIPRVKP